VSVDARRASPQAAARDSTAGAILDAAIEEMAAHGYHGTSVRDIAARVGVSAGVLYYHFKSKQDLLVAILTTSMDRLVRQTEDALFDAGSAPVDRLRAIVGVHVLLHTERQRESLLGNSELRSLESAGRALVVAGRDAQQRMFDRVVADGVKRGVFHTPLPAEAARSVVSACTAVASWYRVGGPLTPGQIVERYQRVALDTVGYREPA
jgi:AcrR family transcriptional regulator